MKPAYGNICPGSINRGLVLTVWIAMDSLGLLSAMGCAGTVQSTFHSPSPAEAGVACVAILPFDNASDVPEARNIFPELLAVELYRSGKVNVLESAEVERIMDRQGMAMDGAMDADAARTIGRALGVDGVIVGSIAEYGFRNMSRKASSVPVSSVRASLVHVKSGDVLWDGSAAENGFDLSLSHRMPLVNVAQVTAEKLLAPLLDAFPGRDGNGASICWRQPGSLDIAKVSAPAPAPAPARPVIRLTKPQKDIYDALVQSRTSMLEGVTYKPGGVALAPASIASLQNAGPAIKAILETNPSVTIAVEGHSDAMENETPKLEVSLGRAERVREFLVRNFSLPANRVTAIGAGSGKPLMPNTTARGRTRNRRVEIRTVASPPPPASP